MFWQSQSWDWYDTQKWTWRNFLATTKVEQAINAHEDIELLAEFRWLHICSSMGIRKIIIESDCLLMVREIQDAGRSTSMLGNIDAKIKRVQSFFKDYEILPYILRT